MRTIYLTLLFFLFSTPKIFAQSKMLSELISIPVEIKNNQGAFQLAYGASQYSYQAFNLLNISSLELQATDLIVHFSINHPDPSVSYTSSLALEAEDGSLGYADYASLSGIKNNDKSQILIWRDVLEEQMDIGKKYTLLIHTEAYGTICETIPEKNIVQDLPYMGAAVLGIGMIGVGQVYKSQSNKAEEEYLQIWREGGVADLEEARQDFETYRNLTYAGLGVLALDGILYYLKQQKLRKQKLRYRTFCKDKPVVDIHPIYSPGLDLGFKLKLNF